jgi:hypothetical protein
MTGIDATSVPQKGHVPADERSTAAAHLRHRTTTGDARMFT